MYVDAAPKREKKNEILLMGGWIGMKQLESKTKPIEKYIYLSNLRNSNVHLFYRLVLDNFTV